MVFAVLTYYVVILTYHFVIRIDVDHVYRVSEIKHESGSLMLRVRKL